MLKSVLAIFGVILISGTAHASSCNESNRLDDYLYEWLNSSPASLATAKQQYAKWNQEDAGRQGIISEYKDYFGQRAAPIAEIGYCTSVQLFDRVGYALSRFK